MSHTFSDFFFVPACTLDTYSEKRRMALCTIFSYLHSLINTNSVFLIGQFWNIPINIERYTGPLQDGVFTNDNYIVSINYPEQEPRRFLAMLDTPLWDKSRKGYCLYAGNSQGGKLVELESPNDSVIEGEYTDYMVSDSFAYEFSYSHFDDSECS